MRRQSLLAAITALPLALTGCGNATPTVTAPQRVSVPTVGDKPPETIVQNPEQQFDTWLKKPRQTRTQASLVQPISPTSKLSSEKPPGDWRTPEFCDLEAEISGENTAIGRIIQYAIFASLSPEETQKLVEAERNKWVDKRK
jgi:hypothetical protein